MATDPAPRVLTEMTDLLRGAPEEPGNILWRLAESGRQLDANVVRLRPDTGVGEHVEPELDVLLYVTEGGGQLRVGGEPRPLSPGSLAWLPRGTGRALAAGPDGLVYVTVHGRRPGATIRTARAEPAGGEPACRLHRVCAECGRLAGESDARFCARCGAELPEPA
ncbi:cupin domain-containing protein [Streptomyces mayteni]